MKRVFALILAAMLMVTGVAAAEEDEEEEICTLPAANEGHRERDTISTDEAGFIAAAEAYTGEGEVMDVIYVEFIVLETEPVTVTFTLETALEGNIFVVVEAGDYTEELSAVANADGTVSVDMTPDSMAALQNGGYILFIAK